MASRDSILVLYFLALGNLSAILLISMTVGFFEYAAALIFFGNFYFNIVIQLALILVTAYLVYQSIKHAGERAFWFAAILCNIFVYLAAPILATVFSYRGP